MRHSESLLQVDTLMIELGYGLVSMADPAKGETYCNGLPRQEIICAGHGFHRAIHPPA